MRRAGDTHGAVDQHLSVRRQAKRHLIRQRGVQTVLIDAKVKGIEQVFDDLAEGQGHNGEVVAVQAEHRNADQESEERCQCDADEKRQQKAEAVRQHAVSQKRKHRTPECTDAHETGVAEGQLPQNADADIEAHRHDRVIHHGDQKTLQMA